MRRAVWIAALAVAVLAGDRLIGGPPTRTPGRTAVVYCGGSRWVYAYHGPRPPEWRTSCRKFRG
ncbi:MAG: hypothetical protein WBB74_01050 [Gaiellaceae bacterium]